jgi:hypothetical protein
MNYEPLKPGQSEATARVSSASLEQREAMLADLLNGMRQLHRRRRIRRKLTTAAIVPAIMLAAIFVFRGAPTRTPSPPAQIVHVQAAVHQSAVILQVQTDPSLLDRYRATAKPAATSIDDQLLLATLAQLNRPAGLIQTHERAWLTRPVADDALPWNAGGDEDS